MKNKKIVLFTIIGALMLVFISLSVFFALQGISASNKRQEYFEAYKAQAKEYINTSPEIKSKYGNTFSVTFDNSVTYVEGEKKASSTDALRFLRHKRLTLLRNLAII